MHILQWYMAKWCHIRPNIISVLLIYKKKKTLNGSKSGSIFRRLQGKRMPVLGVKKTQKITGLAFTRCDAVWDS